MPINGKTKVQRKELAPVVLTQNDVVSYDSTPNTGEMDDETISKLVKDINKLGQRDHELIYRALRKHKPASFFAVNGLGTCFNIFMLPEKVRWELYNIVKLSIQNLARERQISAAKDGHANVLTQLDASLMTNLPAHAFIDVEDGQEDRRRWMLNLGDSE